MYGLKIGNSTSKDIQKSSKAGFKAYACLVTQPAIRNKVINIIKRSNIECSDIIIADILNYLEEDLLNHDYDEDKAWNEEVLTQMSIENYIISRTRYAILTYNERKKAHKIIVKNGDKVKSSIFVQTFSLDAALGNDDDTNHKSLQDKIADEYSAALLDAVIANNNIDSLVERITHLAIQSDTNINIVIYASACLSLWCDKNYNEANAIKQILNVLGLDNYISMKEFIHNNEFIDIYKEVANITDKEQFIRKLAKNIFCVKEITAIIKWLANEINSNTD